MHELAQMPLGHQDGDPNPQQPFTTGKTPARIFLRNHSAKMKRKYVEVGVSFRRGAAEALQADAELRKVYNIATLEAARERGIDKNVYREKIQPVIFAPMFDGKRYPVPPAKPGEDEPPLIQVPEGIWDLLCGNYERMRSSDARVQADEQTRFANSQVWKHSPVRYITIDGKRTEKENPFGFIEIERRTEKFEPIIPDMEFLTGLDLVES